METSAPLQSPSSRYLKVSSPLHTILLLAALGGWTLRAMILTHQLKAASNPSRVRLYLLSIFLEWFFFICSGGRAA
jgi:hypothetical protein